MDRIWPLFRQLSLRKDTVCHFREKRLLVDSEAIGQATGEAPLGSPGIGQSSNAYMI